MPSFEQEYECLHHYVALRDLTQDMYILKFPRNNCLDFLHRISTNSLRDLPVYCFQKTIFTTDKGRIIDTAYILHLEDQVLLIAHSVHQKKLLDWLQRYAILEDITIERSQKYVLVEILGKKAKTVLSENLKLPILHENKIYMSTLANQNFYLFSTSNYPYSVYCLIDRIISLAIIQENLEKFGISIYQISGFTYNIYRIEYGIPIAPYELNETINPHEACLLDAVNFTKGCYIGQEVIARLRTYDKVQKYLTG
ncbi:MAG: hypothetical protein NZM44_02905, partial [Candidatus Calescibacterium sp.]|nr:hypothetical protein [Candidatus Calescibacterium sp.]